jgi:hypothetical protein
LKKSNVFGVLCVLVVVLIGWLVYSNKIVVQRNPMSYLEAIDKVFSSNISDMSVVVYKTTNLQGSDSDIYKVAAIGNKADNFSANTKEGVKLWSTKQLFLSLKDLNMHTGTPGMFEAKVNDYYIIHINQVNETGKANQTGISELYLFVDPKTNHIYIPENYYDSNKLRTVGTPYIKFEPNEITKKLINDVLEK